MIADRFLVSAHRGDIRCKGAVDGCVGEDRAEGVAIDIQSALVGMISGTQASYGATAHGNGELRAGLGIAKNLRDVVAQLSLWDGATLHSCYTA